MAQEDELSDATARGGGDHPLKDFLQTNLVANNAMYGAPNIDPLLINGWAVWVCEKREHPSLEERKSEGRRALFALSLC